MIVITIPTLFSHPRQFCNQPFRVCFRNKFLYSFKGCVDLDTGVSIFIAIIGFAIAILRWLIPMLGYKCRKRKGVQGVC